MTKIKTPKSVFQNLKPGFLCRFLKQNVFVILSSLLVLIIPGLQTSTLASPPPPASNTTAPYKTTYTAKLMSAAGTPITVATSVRFSLWNTSDWQATDVDGLGNIDILSPGYAGWQETYTVTPNADGIFTVELGATNIFPNFTSSQHVYLEVDVKPSASPNTAFEVLDPDGNTANTTDRKPFNSAPYAVNSDTVDNRDAGNGPGNIPILDGAGKLIFGVLPDGVNANTFTLDQDNNAPLNVIVLQFGNALGEYLRFNGPATRFEFSKSLNINGNLTFTGTGNITGSTIDGTLNTIINIPLSALAPYAKQIRLTPEFPDATHHPDGTNNNGRLLTAYEDLGPGARYNYYQWTTNKAAAQDMDIIIRYQLPTDFVAFTAAPLNLNYQTADLVPANNSIDLTLNDSTGAAVTLAGASSLVSAATWANSAITFIGVPTFTPGTFIEFKFHISSLNSGKYAKIGDLVLNYTGR